MSFSLIRQRIRKYTHIDEHQVVSELVAQPILNNQQRRQVVEDARRLVTESREDSQGQSPIDSFLLEFGLSNKEGVTLMCLAESLLRVPDRLSADRLIAEKVKSGDWSSHLGQSDSLFVNSSTWGLLLTGQLVQLDAEICDQPGGWVKQLSAKLGEPIVRTAFMQAMKLMGQHYVLGRDIQEGLSQDQSAVQTKSGNVNKIRYSFDMLGEGARTEADAKRYLEAYLNAIEAIGAANLSIDVYQANGISVKLSALHPRYEFSQRERVMAELLPRIKELCVTAYRHNISLSIDAEEAARLDLELDIFESLANDPSLNGWLGLGFVLQAYQKRAPQVVDWLVELAQKTDRRLMVRLVKGAYWDYEIKHAQEQGLKDYPVFTRKTHTDLCYLFCAQKLLAASKKIFSQFATHNAYTACAVLEMASSMDDKPDFEFQRLHGMGDLLYKHIKAKASYGQVPLRVYAPIGRHEDLLPYLVRRLLENGANSSFVNRFLDKHTPVDALVSDLYEKVEKASHHRHAGIPFPEDIYLDFGEPRKNSKGVDLDFVSDVEPILDHLKSRNQGAQNACSIVSGISVGGRSLPNLNPAKTSSPIGEVAEVAEAQIGAALRAADSQSNSWKAVPVSQRALILENMAGLLEAHKLELIQLIVTEAGRTIPDAVSEVREAVDFCRYYGIQGERILAKKSELEACGVFLCISPWNFPLAIFVGQVAAALASGNTVIAKPAAQTPLIATKAVQLFHEAGIPIDALHLLIGSGSKIGGLLLPDARVSGVCFTGSTETAKTIYQVLASRAGAPIPLIAETGGQNCLIADSTALPEQLVDDAISSAFLSAGQRCSAMRVLFVQEEIADKVLEMLKGAMKSLKVGDPAVLSTDIGPVIDESAREELDRHAEKMATACKSSFELALDVECQSGNFFAPRIYEIDSLDQLKKEVFGPILHVIRYRSDKLDDVIRQVNNTGFGLTLGIHSRIEAFADYVISKTDVGNNYINRNMVGAVVGVNPFGGMGLSGTGPKAGGPNYLYRFCRFTDENMDVLPSLDFNQPATQTSYELADLASESKSAFYKFRGIEPASRITSLKDVFGDAWNDPGFMAAALTKKFESPIELPGPTGELNQLSAEGRGMIACLLHSNDRAEILNLLALVLLSGCSVVAFGSAPVLEVIREFKDRLKKTELPIGVIQASPIENFLKFVSENPVDGALVANVGYDLRAVKRALVKETGPLVPAVEFPRKLKGMSEACSESLLTNLSIEKTRTENLVAKGGNTQLFNINDEADA